MTDVTSPNSAIRNELNFACDIIMKVECPDDLFTNADSKIANELIRATLLSWVGRLVSAPRGAIDSLALNRNRKVRRYGGTTFPVLAVRNVYLFTLYWLIANRVRETSFFESSTKNQKFIKKTSIDFLFDLLYEILPEQVESKIIKELKQNIIDVTKREKMIFNSKKYLQKRGLGLIIIVEDENSEIRVFGKGIKDEFVQLLQISKSFNFGEKTQILKTIPLDKSLERIKVLSSTTGSNTKRYLKTYANEKGDLAQRTLRFETALSFSDHLKSVPAWIEGGQRLVSEYESVIHSKIRRKNGKRN